MKITVSFIIPVYNVAEYLPRCINSILEQNFSDYEIILVDDGSKDKSGKICDEYSESHENIIAIHQANKGSSAARNRGIEIANGKWIWFVDGDDWIAEGAMDDVMHIVDKDHVDMAMFGYHVVKDNYQCEQKSIEQKNITAIDALIEMYAPKHCIYQGYVWNKVFRTSIIKEHNVRFNESIFYNEDRLFVVDFLCNSMKRVAYSTKPIYNYYQRVTGIMESAKKSYHQKFATDFDAFVLMLEEIRKTPAASPAIRHAQKGVAFAYMTHHKKMIECNSLDENLHKHMKKELWRTGAWIQYMMMILKETIKQMLKKLCTFIPFS